MSEPYDLGFGLMCAQVFEGQIEECDCHSRTQTCLSAREPLSESVSTSEPVL